MGSKKSMSFRERLTEIQENGELIYEHTDDGSVGDPVTGYLGTRGNELCNLLRYSESDVKAFAVWLEEAMDDDGPFEDLSEAVWLVFWMWTSGSTDEYLEDPSFRCFGPPIKSDGEESDCMHGSVPDEYINFAGLMDNVAKILAESEGIKSSIPKGPWLQMRDLEELFTIDRKTISEHARKNKDLITKKPVGSYPLYNLRSALIVLGSSMDCKEKKIASKKYPEVWAWYLTQ